LSFSEEVATFFILCIFNFNYLLKADLLVLLVPYFFLCVLAGNLREKNQTFPDASAFLTGSKICLST